MICVQLMYSSTSLHMDNNLEAANIATAVQLLPHSFVGVKPQLSKGSVLALWSPVHCLNTSL